MHKKYYKANNKSVRSHKRNSVMSEKSYEGIEWFWDSFSDQIILGVIFMIAFSPMEIFFTKQLFRAIWH
jgi:hypothetical protein